MSISNRRPIKATDAMAAPMMAVTFGGSGHTGGQSTESFTDVPNMKPGEKETGNVGQFC